MSFKDVVRATGNQIKLGPNTKGTDRRGVPSAISQLGRTEASPAVENPSKVGRSQVGSGIKPLGKLNGKRKISTKI